MIHQNNGNCPGCANIFEAYPGFYKPLRDWFEEFQSKHPEAHISCAGRGRKEQEEAFKYRTSRAEFGKSAHNYNCAIDIFEDCGDRKNLWENKWFQNVLKPAIESHPELCWYGKPDAIFRELPHVEWENWRTLVAQGDVKIVEPLE